MAVDGALSWDKVCEEVVELHGHGWGLIVR
jgi:hypothetical protein